MEKRLNVSYSRPSYAAFYPKGQEGNARQIKIVSPPSQPIWYVSAEISIILVIILFEIFNFQNSNQFKMSQNSVFCLISHFVCCRPSTTYTSRPVASVKPMITTPVPMQPKGVGRGENRNLPIISKNKPGVSVHKVLTTTGI